MPVCLRHVETSGNDSPREESMSSHGDDHGQDATRDAQGRPLPASRIGTGQAIYAVCILFGINTMNFYDRQVVGAVGELVREEWGLNDRQLSALTIAFVLLYAVVGLPLGYWADVGRRKFILATGVLLWSVMTALS